MRLLLDENLPVALRGLLPGHEVETVRSTSWLGLSNGKLLAAAEKAGCDALMTADQGIPHQNALEGRRITILELSNNHWPTIKAGIPRILRELAEVDELHIAQRGRFVTIGLSDRPGPRPGPDPS